MDHSPNAKTKCPATDKACSNCGKLGHFAKQCRAKGKSEQHPRASNVREVEQQADMNDNFAFRINTVSKSSDRILVDLLLNGNPVTMQLDTAADVTTVSEEVAKTIPNLNTEPSTEVLMDYNSQMSPDKGAANVGVTYEQQEFHDLPLTIMEGNRPSLFGLDWLKAIPLDLQKALKVNSDSNLQVDVNRLPAEFQEVFDERVGTVNGVQAFCLSNLTPLQNFAPHGQFLLH